MLRGKSSKGTFLDMLSVQYEVVVADHFDEALEALRTEEFDAVLSETSDFLPLERAAMAEQASVILETVAQGVCVIDLNGHILWCNEVLRRLSQELLDRMPHQCAALFTPTSVDKDVDLHSRKLSIQTSDERYYEVTANPVLDADGNVQQIAAVVWDATDARRSQLKIDTIDRVGRELVKLEGESLSAMGVDERLALLERKIIRSVRQVLGYDNFCVRLLDKKNNRLELVLSNGLTPEGKEIDIFANSEGNGICGYVAATGRSYICADVREDRRYLPGIDNPGSTLTVPLQLHDQVIGVFNIETTREAAFREEDRQFAEIFARYVAIALHILDLLVVERHQTSGQLARDVTAELSEPLNDILTDATNLMEEYIGQDDLRHRLQTICDNVDKIRQSVKQVSDSPTSLIQGRYNKPACLDDVLQGKRILVADDESLIRETLKEVLERCGSHVEVAEDGNVAIEKLSDNNVDLVLSDIKMPHKSGYDIFAASKHTSPDRPVILMTGFGYDPHHSIIRARPEGLAGVLFKPFKVDQMLETVRAALQQVKD